MPRFLPWPAALVAISGAAEVAGGLGVLRKETRRPAGWGLILLLVAVFPANIHSIATGIKVAGVAVPSWMLLARLPLQLALIWWVYRACLTSGSSREKDQA